MVPGAMMHTIHTRAPNSTPDILAKLLGLLHLRSHFVPFLAPCSISVCFFLYTSLFAFDKFGHALLRPSTVIMPYQWNAERERQMLLLAISRANLRPSADTWTAVSALLGGGLTASAVR
jgi:hypothetical protein